MLSDYLFLIPIFLFISSNLRAEEVKKGTWHFRAREHFESHKINIDDKSYGYMGLSNTLNYWYEEPYRISYGFSLSPMIGSARKTGDRAPDLSSRITVISIGGEFKYFCISETPLFTRLGIGWSQLRGSSGFKESNGFNTYAGIGYEIPFEKLGVAFELAHRRSYLQNSIRIDSFTPSIGFHFYKM